MPDFPERQTERERELETSLKLSTVFSISLICSSSMADTVSPNKKLASFKLLHNIKRVFEHPPAIAGIFVVMVYNVPDKENFCNFCNLKIKFDISWQNLDFYHYCLCGDTDDAFLQICVSWVKERDKVSVVPYFAKKRKTKRDFLIVLSCVYYTISLILSNLFVENLI